MGTTATRTRHQACGPDELLVMLDATARALSALPVCAPSAGSRAGWGEVVRTCQRVVNAASAVQDEAIVALAAIEPVFLEDGTEVESHRVPGHVALDAPALVAGALDVSEVHAERRVRGAVRLAADGSPGTTTCTGLGGLHEAMRAGALDAYRASVVADELELAPAEVAEAVVTTLGEHLGLETAPQLRRRCRRLLSRISPDLLRRRAERAREECGLRRWMAEPGVDQWEGTFPSEDAAQAWSAIDARAQQLVTDGTCARIDRARAQALIDLVTGNATITTLVTLTVPATTTTSAPGTGQTAGLSGSGELVEVPNPLAGEPMLVPGPWLDAMLTSPTTTVRVVPCDPVTGALRSDVTTTAYRPPDRLASLVRQRDARCRFPGCHVAARFCDLDHVLPWPLGPTSDANLLCLCRRHHRVKQRPGWHVTLHPDHTAVWTDPTARVRTTLPVDALHPVTLPAPPALPALRLAPR